MDQTNDRLVRNTRNIRVVGRKSDTCCKSWDLVLDFGLVLGLVLRLNYLNMKFIINYS